MSIICRSCRNNIKINVQCQQNRVFSMTSLYDMCRGASRQMRQLLGNDVALSGLFVLIPNPVFSPRVSSRQKISNSSSKWYISWSLFDTTSSEGWVVVVTWHRLWHIMINSRMCRRNLGGESTSNNSIMNHRVKICVTGCHEFTSSDQTSERWVIIILFGPIRRLRCLHHNRSRRYHFRR